MHMKKGLQKKILGFTLVEIMIVVTIIGILASLAVPAFQRARWKALETSIRNNLRQIWGAAQQYMLENGVSKVDAMNIVAWKPKVENKEANCGTNLGYTSILQQISDEDYSEIGVYGPAAEKEDEEKEQVTTEDQEDANQPATLSISDYTDNEFSADGWSEVNMSITEDAQGLIIKAGSRYVKLRL